MDIIINLDKPKHISSQNAVNRVKKSLGARKAGHAGTLDPIATGVLLVCTDEATKITGFLSGLDKEYTAKLRLGEKTDTMDSEGSVIQKKEIPALSEKDIEPVLRKFTGLIQQTPPMYSAVKIDGKPLYKLARKGITIERPQRSVNISSIELTAVDLPFVEIRVSCSKGTYIRSLCNDIGDALNTGAHVVELRRMRIGNFRIEEAITMDRIIQSPAPTTKHDKPAFLSIDAALRHLSEFVLTEEQFARARNGVPIANPFQAAGSEHVKLKDPAGNLFAIGRVSGKKIKIERMLLLDFLKALF